MLTPRRIASRCASAFRFTVTLASACATAGTSKQIHASRMARLEHLLALARAQDAALLAILRDCTACDVDAALLEQLDDLLIRVRALRVLARHQLLDLRLHRLRCEVLAVRARDTAV